MKFHFESISIQKIHFFNFKKCSNIHTMIVRNISTIGSNEFSSTLQHDLLIRKGSVDSRRRRTALSVSCPCLVFFRKILSCVCLLSGVRILSKFSKKSLSVVCLPGRTKTRQSCPDFRCPCPPTSGGQSTVDCCPCYMDSQWTVLDGLCGTNDRICPWITTL